MAKLRTVVFRWMGVLGVLTALGLLVGVGLALTLWHLFTGSLPPTEGVHPVKGLVRSVRIDRDDRGVPTLTASNRLDLAFATGFVHAQDRFFQMDLLRRRAAGELAELFGPALIDADREMRLHRFRARSRHSLLLVSQQERALLDAYVQGVAAGLDSLRQPPWEYLLLGQSPRPWQAEDTLLVALGMYAMLQDDCVPRERCQAVLREALPAALADYLSPPGSIWDAPLMGPALAARPIPTPDQVDLRQNPRQWIAQGPPSELPGAVLGSNNWAVAGQHTRHGGAILANDMHLGLFVPNIWYRAAFSWQDRNEGHQAVGVTLPGTPLLIVGSNTHVAWGFTNSSGDFADLVLVEMDPTRPGHYRTAAGPVPVERHEELIRVRGGKPVTMVVEQTIWGPILDRDRRGRPRAVRWVAHELDAVNLGLSRLETARSLEEAMTLAPAAAVPMQNLMLADRRGRIGWTLIGRMPRRQGFDGRLPQSWADGKLGWDGWVSLRDYPRLLDPPEGRLWTANNRTVDEPWLSRLGRGGFDHGARARQIRDGLRQRDKVSESDMLAIQLDDRALFLQRWQELLLEVLQGADEQRAVMRALVRDWGGRAATHSVGFRLVREFRREVMVRVLDSLTAPCRRLDPRFNARWLDANVEDAVWQLLRDQPAHLLPPGQPGWQQLLVDCVEKLNQQVQNSAGDMGFEAALAYYTWGSANQARIRHPFSQVLGPVGRWLRLDMPEEPLPGDSRAMPRIQGPSEGASERLAVSPGREAEGYFHMATGQSGHPLSPHYRDGHADWVLGRPAPLLPGPAVRTLVLELAD